MKLKKNKGDIMFSFFANLFKPKPKKVLKRTHLQIMTKKELENSKLDLYYTHNIKGILYNMGFHAC